VSQPVSYRIRIRAIELDTVCAIEPFPEIHPSASQVEVIDVEYFLARTLESAWQIAEAATLLRRIAQMNPRFKDAAYRAKELSSKLKHSTKCQRRGAANGSWFSNAIKSFNRWPLVASK
jgi:hypothetical protein